MNWRIGDILPWCLLFAIGCGTDRAVVNVDGSLAPPVATRVGQTRGSAAVLSRDERIAVVTNRSSGVVTVLALDPSAPTDAMVSAKAEIELGVDWEPWAAVIGADDDTAYVVSRSKQVVVRILRLHAAPVRDDDMNDVAVGSEPTAIAIAPSGAKLFVANWGEGTISVISTLGFRPQARLDLNGALAGSGLLGDVKARAALAHPRALAMTDNGDTSDADETLYATEFFSQPIVGASEDVTDLKRVDRNRQGLVYPIPLASGEAGAPIAIAPVIDTGFFDSNNGEAKPDRAATSCFPNQLYAAAASGGRLFVTSMCTSPAGPVGAPSDAPSDTSNFKTLMHPALFVIDTATNVELPEQRALLTRRLEDSYASDGTDVTARRMPLIPNDLDVRPLPSGGLKACVTAFGADALFCVHYDANGAGEVGAKDVRFVDLLPPTLEAGQLPIGVAMAKQDGRSFAIVSNDNTQNVSMIDLERSSVTAQIPMAEQTINAKRARALASWEGRQKFATGLLSWSLDGQAWSSCEGCHPDGLSDGVTWFFARGPRRTIATAGTYNGAGAAARRRVMLWTGNLDEVHDVEAIVRGVSGGAGAIVWTYSGSQPSNRKRIIFDGSRVPASAPDAPPGPKRSSSLRNNLNGSLASMVVKGAAACDENAEACDETGVEDWDSIDAFIRTVRAPRAPTYLSPALVERGREIFNEKRCAGCHAGPGFTLSKVFYTPGPANNGALPLPAPAMADASEDALRGALRTVRYSVPDEWKGLNPPAAASGSAPVRRWAPGAATWFDYVYDTMKAGADQINCVLRAVGTFPAAPLTPPSVPGIVPPGAPPVSEVRPGAVAFGETGFNIPSLLGLAVGAPYFHAGNARTLEEVFANVFMQHERAFAPAATTPDTPEQRAEQVPALVAYLLSIDDGAGEPPSVASSLGFDPDFCAAAAREICAMATDPGEQRCPP